MQLLTPTHTMRQPVGSFPLVLLKIGALGSQRHRWYEIAVMF